jgi:2-methylcitrate dehydratase PrpD
LSSDTGNTAIEALSANILETRFENFDQATVENARSRIIDVLGCGIGGANAVGNAALVELVKDWGGKPEASILVHGGRVPAHNAAMVNSIMARSFDFEPVGVLFEGKFIPAHISGTTVMTAITLGEMKNIDGKELVTALLVGDDITSRVLVATSFNLGRGWDNTGTVNMIGATAIAGRLLGLNERQLRHAFGIVLNQLAGSLQNVWDFSTAFKLPQGLSARNGIFSAQLAKAGWTGPEDMLLGRYGYTNLYAQGCENPDILTKDLGKQYYSDSSFKPYPSCRGTNPPIDCATEIFRKYGVKADDIAEVVHYVPKEELELFCAAPFRIGDFPHANAAFSYQYTVANALLRGCSKPEHFSEDAIRDPQVNALISKIRFEELPGERMLGATKLEVRMKDGRQFSEFTDAPKGDPIRNPMSRDEIKDKFRANVEFSQTVTMNNAEKVLELLDNLEEIDSVDKIVELLVIS